MKRSTELSDRERTAFCEEPEAFHIFSSSDGLVARRRANVKGLVAIYLGVSRWNKWSLNGKIYDYLAIPGGLAERLASGALIAVDKEDPHVRRALMILRGRMTEHVGRKVRLQLTDAETRRDIERQIRLMSLGE